MTRYANQAEIVSILDYRPRPRSGRELVSIQFAEPTARTTTNTNCLSRWMHWLMNAHVFRHVAVHRTTGHIWQGRFRAFAVQEDDRLRTVIRYVERNPLPANFVDRAEAWPWSSLARLTLPPPLDLGPAPRGDGWIEVANAPMTEAEC